MNNIGGMWLFMEIHLGLLLHPAWPGGGKRVLTSQGLYNIQCIQCIQCICVMDQPNISPNLCNSTFISILFLPTVENKYEMSAVQLIDQCLKDRRSLDGEVESKREEARLEDRANPLLALGGKFQDRLVQVLIPRGSWRWPWSGCSTTRREG